MTLVSKSKLVKTEEDKHDKIKKLELLQKQQAIQEGLPHLYGFPHYKWSREFFESRNRILLLNAANQVGKSSAQIRKIIHWATATDLWPVLWRATPRQFWYLYPTRELATIEVEKKWMPEFLPRGEFKKHPVYGWDLERGNLGRIHAIHFNTGVSIYFKTYMTDVQALQAGTVHYLATDEELPVDLFDELKFRLSASDGYFSMVFTATLSQPQWHRAMERIGKEDEFLPQASKWQVSKYDCLTYDDGSPSPWTLPRIRAEEASCSSQNEIQRRIYGRFVMDKSLLRFVFNRDIHTVSSYALETLQSTIYVGIDQGSGGNENHPSAIVFLLVNKEYTKGVVFQAWRGDGITTTAGDTFDKYRSFCHLLPYPPIQVHYDHAAVDLKTLSDRSGESFIPANKAREAGIDTINSLFQYRSLLLYTKDPEVNKLAIELESIRTETKKSDDTIDDLSDALRYAVMAVPWDWVKIKELMGRDPILASEREQSAIDYRRKLRAPVEDREDELGMQSAYEEMREWDDLMNG